MYQYTDTKNRNILYSPDVICYEGPILQNQEKHSSHFQSSSPHFSLNCNISLNIKTLLFWLCVLIM